MSTRAETIEYLTDQLSDLPSIRTAKMFGEYALYLDEKVIGFVCDDQLFIKPTDAGREFIGTPEEAPAYPGSKLYYLISGDRWEDREWLAELATVTADALPRPKPKKPKKSRSGPAATSAAPDQSTST